MNPGRAVAAALNRLVIRMHSPVETGVATPRFACVRHRRPIEWPCREFNAATERYVELSKGRP